MLITPVGIVEVERVRRSIVRLVRGPRRRISEPTVGGLVKGRRSIMLVRKIGCRRQRRDLRRRREARGRGRVIAIVVCRREPVLRGSVVGRHLVLWAGNIERVLWRVRGVVESWRKHLGRI